MLFPISGVEAPVWLPPLVAFGISFFTSMGGVSGAFLLLPFQVSILGYTAPSVSATNQVFNIVAIPSGVYRYIKEGRMLWPLTTSVIIGTLPGVFIGAWLRVEYLPDPTNFKFFAGLVLLFIGVRLFQDIIKIKNKADVKSQSVGSDPMTAVRVNRSSVREVEFEFNDELFLFSPLIVFFLCLFVGVAGGIYGIGGGSIVAPFLVAIMGPPVYTIAGAALMGTFVTSVASVVFYQVLAPFYPSMSVAPDWYLGGLFGIGGFAGIYLGARCQKFVPARIIKIILCVCVLFVAGKYVIGFLIK